jgi:hypothetical protein
MKSKINKKIKHKRFENLGNAHKNTQREKKERNPLI